MSDENVEIVRNAFAYQYFGRGGPTAAETYFTADIQMKPADGAVVEERTVGRSSIRTNVERWESAWDDLDVNATLRDGKVARVDEFLERSQALEAAGLSA